MTLWKVIRWPPSNIWLPSWPVRPVPRTAEVSDDIEKGEHAVKEVLNDIDRWRSAGKRVAVARVVGVEGSGPRLPGAAMAVAEDGEVAGSVSGGCVEGAVLTEALDILNGDGTPRLCTFGYSDDDAFAVGLTCGGTIHVFIEPLDWWGISTKTWPRPSGPNSRRPWPRCSRVRRSCLAASC